MMFVACSSSPQSTGNSAMHLVASQNHFEMVEWITDTLGVDSLGVTNHLGRNPLHLACQAGSIESLEYMVEAGGELTAVASNGDTPLHVCVAEGHIKMSNVLIGLGADYDATNKVRPGASALLCPYCTLQWLW
jgi:ankyrin repeat protein